MPKKGSVFTGPFFILFFCSIAWSQKFETTVEDFYFNTSNRVVIDQETIEKSKAPDIQTLLATQANISILNTPFQSTSLSIRGGDSGHVLIIVDGIPFYDPSNIQRTGALSLIDIRSVKKIEILKGSQSVLYGGQALSGVIKIDTIGDEKNVFGEFGTHDYVALGGDAGFLRAYGKKREAESPAKNSKETYSFKQGQADALHKIRNGYFKLSYSANESFSPTSDTNFEIVDVKDFRLLHETAGVSGVIDLNPISKLSFGLSQNLRRYDYPAGAMNEDYKSNFHFLRFDLVPYRNENLRIDSGASYTFENFHYRDAGITQAKKFLEQKSIFTKLNYKFLSVGARAEKSSLEQNFYAFHAGLTFDKTKFEVSSGYKTPTLYQLFSKYGEPRLKGEKGTQYSLIQEWDSLSVTAFYSQYRDRISTVGNFPNLKYVNINKSRTRGLEARYAFENLSVTAGYQEPYDEVLHSWLARRPLVNGSIRYIYTDGPTTGNVEVIYVGDRRDIGPNGYLKLDGYAMAHFTYSYQLKTKDVLYARIQNLLDLKTQETYRYYSEGRSAILGLSRSW